MTRDVPIPHTMWDEYGSLMTDDETYGHKCVNWNEIITFLLVNAKEVNVNKWETRIWEVMNYKNRMWEILYFNEINGRIQMWHVN